MRVEYWPLERIKPYDKNPRTASKKAREKVAASIREFGFQQPIVVDDAGVIIVGRIRWMAASLLKLDTVPVIVARLSPEKARAYRIADNRLHEETTWLEDLLADELRDLKALDVDLELTGFDEIEIDRFLSIDDELRAAEETPEAAQDPVTTLGDVWILGPHRILCGDSTVAANVDRVCAGAQPVLTVTDPPYGVEYDASWRADAKGKSGAVHATGKVLNDDRADWSEAWRLCPGNVIYVWHGALHGATVDASLHASGYQVRAQIIWVKHRPALSRGHYHWQHEPAFYAVKQGRDDGWRFEDDHELLAYAVRDGQSAGWRGGRRQSTVWEIEHSKNDTGHSTQKPVECMRRPILNNSKPGDAVFEPFSGSGTTIMACEMTGRLCRAIELSPTYVDVAVKRWEQFSGQTAVLEADGRTFAEVQMARSAAAGG
jgi:site-specific DNA-methyltransferase (adenine-specific)